jgi:hypothetical protein
LKFSADDAIVVVEVEKGVCSMEAAVRTLRAKLGDDAMSGLQTLLDDAGQQWKDDVLAITGERFERRLSQEIGALRVDMAKEFASVRVEMATMQANLLKWSFLFWIGQFAAASAMTAFLLRTVGTR